MAVYKFYLSGKEENLKDTITQLLAEIQLQEQTKSNDLYYSIPIEDYQIQRKFKPQCTLHFWQIPEEVKTKFRPIEAQISFRLMGKESTNITKQNILDLATKIKTKFGGKTPFQFIKGKELWSYTEPVKGYSLQLYVRDEAQARKAIEQTLDLQGHSPDWKKLRRNTAPNPEVVFPDRPDREVILGESRVMPRRRPGGTVEFRYATLFIWGLPNPYILYDRTGQAKSPVLK